MVLNRPVRDMEEGEPLSEWLGSDEHVPDDLVVGDGIEVELPDGTVYAGEPVRFDAMGGGSAHRGHNILLDAGAEDAEGGRVRVHTRTGQGVTVALDRPGAGMNETILEAGGDAEIRRA